MKILSILATCLFFIVVSFLFVGALSVCYAVISSPTVEPINQFVAYVFSGFMLFVWALVSVMIFQTEDW